MENMFEKTVFRVMLVSNSIGPRPPEEMRLWVTIETV